MAVKPTQVGRWANVGGLIVEPPSIKKDSGWLAGEVAPPAEYFNWLANLDFQWQEYLRDGVLFGNHSINADGTGDGNLAIEGELEVQGPCGFENAVEINGNVTFNDEISILNGALLFSTGGAEFAGPMDVGGDLQSDRNYFTVSDRLGIAACMMNTPTPAACSYLTSTGVDAGGWLVANNGRLHIPVPIMEGAQLLSVIIHGEANEAGNRLLRLHKIDSGGIGSAIVSTITVSTTGEGPRTFNFPDTVLIPGVYQMEYQAPAIAADIIRGAIIIWNRPRNP